MQAATLDYFFVLDVSHRFVASDGFVPLLGRYRILVAGVIEISNAAVFDPNFVDGNYAGNAFLLALLLSHELEVAAEQNVGAAARHVGGDGDHAHTAGLGYIFGFFLLKLRVQNNILLDALLL